MQIYTKKDVCVISLKECSWFQLHISRFTTSLLHLKTANTTSCFVSMHHNSADKLNVLLSRCWTQDKHRSIVPSLLYKMFSSPACHILLFLVMHSSQRTKALNVPFNRQALHDAQRVLLACEPYALSFPLSAWHAKTRAPWVPSCRTRSTLLWLRLATKHWWHSVKFRQTG